MSKHVVRRPLLLSGLAVSAPLQVSTRLNSLSSGWCGVRPPHPVRRWGRVGGSPLQAWQFRSPSQVGLFRHANSEPANEQSPRGAWAVWARAVVVFLTSLLIGTLAGAPYSYSGEQPRATQGLNLFWSFWVRLPIVLVGGYYAYPWLCELACKHFPASESLIQVITNLFAPIVSLIYAIIAGQVVVSLWSRLYTVRNLLNREIAALELLERRIPADNTVAIRLFSEHLVGIDKYAIQLGTLAPNSYNKLADLAELPALRADGSIQDVIDRLADLRAERRANVEIGYPRTLWGTLRVCALILVGCFVILTQRLGAGSAPAQWGVRIIFCVFLLTVFWVNHLCRDLASLNRGEFQIDSDLIRANTALGKMQRRATLFLGKQS